MRCTEGEGILEMSELWLPGATAPLISVGWDRKRRVDFLLGMVAGLLMAINSISHHISLSPLLGSRGVKLVGAALLL